MGTYLNPGKAAFQEAIDSKIYVDKTEMIMYLNSVVRTKQKYVSVSRPRRFGKTMAADMICAYYDREAESRPLFEEKRIAECDSVWVGAHEIKWDSWLGAFDVIRIVMTKFFKSKITVGESLQKMQRNIIKELKKAYPDVDYTDDVDLIETIDNIYSDSARQVVIVIDEWDAVFRERPLDKEGQTEYLDFLRDLMKDNQHIALAYMTGILPIKKYGKHSALNMFDEYSMISPMQLAPYTGFTETEVLELCKRYGRDFQMIKNWYDGYEVSDIIPPDPDHLIMRETGVPPKAQRYALYSPLSVVKAVLTGHIQNYWNKTENYEALAEFIRMDYDGLKDTVALLMDGGRLKIDTSTYQNDMTTFHSKDDIFSLLIHLGYLGYDDETSDVFIPNKEILEEFKTSTKDREWLDAFNAFRTSQQLVQATWAKDHEKVAALLEEAHDRAANKTYNDEAALSYAIQIAYFAARKYYTIIPELDSGKGFADVAYLPAPNYPTIPALVVELKYDKNACGAVEQIKRQNYPDRLEHYKGNILLVGINYNRDIPNTNPEFKRHSCVIEEA